MNSSHKNLSVQIDQGNLICSGLTFVSFCALSEMKCHLPALELELSGLAVIVFPSCVILAYVQPGLTQFSFRT